MSPRLLDLFCGAGGAAMGYYQAGFEVVGVDVDDQPRYPFEFVRADALEFDLDGYDAIHASPPCQAYSTLRSLHPHRYPDLIGAIRYRLRGAGVPWIIENVEGAPLIDPVLLCGSMFDLHVRRHRLFEANFPLTAPRCRHRRQGAAPGPAVPDQNGRKRRSTWGRRSVIGVYGNGQGLGRGEGDLWRAVMDTPWMNKAEMTQAIPPAYTRHLGLQAMVQVGAAVTS